MIGVLGCGNMAAAIVRGAHRAHPELKFLTYTPSHTRAQELALAVDGVATKDLRDFERAQSIVVACKPQQFNQLVDSLRGKFDLSSKHFISIMAALPLKVLQERLGASRVTRVMPNTPALYNEGASLVLHSDSANSDDKKNVEVLFGSCGALHAMNDEEMFDKVTTVSGSGPAYVFLFAQTMANQLRQWGLDSKEARMVVEQLFAGSARLMRERADVDLEELIGQVTSKGGVTIEAVNVYRENQLQEITSKALEAAYARSLQLSEEFGKKPS